MPKIKGMRYLPFYDRSGKAVSGIWLPTEIFNELKTEKKPSLKTRFYLAEQGIEISVRHPRKKNDSEEEVG